MPQYQHYVPNFILRQFSTNYNRPELANFANKKQFEKAKSRANAKAAVNTINFKDGFTKEKVGTSSCNNTFGRPAMYNAEIEEKLSRLEKWASEVIYAIIADFNQGKKQTVLSTAQSNILRKFIATIAYRNRDISDIYGRDFLDLDEHDRGEIGDYMAENNIETPRQVWLKTLGAFVDVDFSLPRDDWLRWLDENAVPGHARTYCEQLYDACLYICTPNDTVDEFLLTQNVYALAADFVVSRDGQEVLHTFFPMSSQLMIVVRHKSRSELSSMAASVTDGNVKTQGCSLAPVDSTSKDCDLPQYWLRDMPLRPPRPTSTPTQDQSVETEFPFNCISGVFVQRINICFLEEAIFSDAIIYRSSAGVQRALKAYLELENPGIKMAVDLNPIDGFDDVVGSQHFDIVPEMYRETYLAMLHRTATILGSTCNLVRNRRLLSSITGLSSLPADFQRRYRKLAFDGSLKTFFCDERQACKLVWLSLFIWDRSPSDAKFGERLKLFMKIARILPRHVWLYLRLLRVYSQYAVPDRGGINTCYPRLVADDNGGWEDSIIDCISVFDSNMVARMMLRASLMQQFKLRNPNATDLDYYLSADEIVGSITDCGIPVLKARIQDFEAFYDSIGEDDLTLRFSGSYKPRAIEIQELLLRCFLSAFLDKLMVEDSVFKQIEGSILKELLFKKLYPFDVLLERPVWIVHSEA